MPYSTGRGWVSVGKSLRAADMLGRAAVRPSEKPDQGGQTTTSHLVAGDESPSRPVGQSPSRPVGQSPSRPVDQSPSRPVDQSPSRLVPEPVRYEKAAVFLTPEQRQWLRSTSKGLTVEGLSMSDLVRLAVERLRTSVEEDGLPLVDELTAQAHAEAQRLAGRRNRGLPPVA